MIMELLKHKDYVRALMVLEHKPLRFNQLQSVLKLNPTQIDRAVTFLRKGLWIIPRTVPVEKNRIIVEYSVGKRGKVSDGRSKARRSSSRMDRRARLERDHSSPVPRTLDQGLPPL